MHETIFLLENIHERNLYKTLNLPIKETEVRDFYLKPNLKYYLFHLPSYPNLT
jgi:hypothetical protein